MVGERLLQCRLGLLQVGLDLANLQVQLRRFDFGNGLARLNTVADIHQAALNVAVGARQDGSLRDRLNVAGEFQFTLAGGASHFDHLYTRKRLFLFLRLRAYDSHTLLQWNIACEKCGDDEYDDAQKDRPDGDGGGMPRLR